MRLYIAILFCLSISFQPLVAQMDTAAWLEENVFNVKSIDPKNENFEDLEFLIPILKDKDMVLLGEESHSFATTFEAKSRLIKFLHQELGFTVLAFEIDGHMISKVNNQGEENETTIQQVLYPFWGQTTSTQELFRYINASQNTTKPIHYTGFDSQVFPRFDLPKDMEDMLQARGCEVLNYRGYDEFMNLFSACYRRQLKGVTLEEFKILNVFIDDMLYYYEHISDASHNELILLNALENVRYALRSYILDEATNNYFRGELNPPDSSETYIGDIRSMGVLNRRDQKMAQNLIWLKENLFPNEKIIVWMATEHSMYNRNEVKKEYEPDFPFHTRFTYGYNYKSTGAYLKEHFGSSLYNVGFSTISGSIDYSRAKGTQYLYDVEVEGGSIESYLLSMEGFKYPFLDFQGEANLPSELFNDKMITNILDANATEGNIADFFDGILFIRDAKPIEYVE